MTPLVLLIGLLLTAVLFVIYPLLRKPANVLGQSQSLENIILYREQLAEFNRQLKGGEIDQSQFDELCTEQQRILLVDSSAEVEKTLSGTRRGGWLILLVLLLLPLLALGLYQLLGARDEVQILRLMEQRATASSVQQDAALRTELIEAVSRQLEEKPDDMYYLVTLARMHTEQANFAAAESTYQRAIAVSPEESEILAEYAQAAYFAAGNVFVDRVNRALENALALDPLNITALGLQGIQAFGTEDYQLAISSWQGALRGLHPASEQAQALQSGIAAARKRLGIAPGDTMAMAPQVVVRVSLSSSVSAESEKIVYIYAKEWQGSPMPLAVARLRVEDLPATVALDDSMAMPGGKLLSAVQSIQLVARVSATGSATPATGDFEGRSDQIALADAAKGVELVIDSKL